MNIEDSIISKIDKSGLCLGCGICESVLGSQSIKMNLESDGFYHPKIKHTTKDKEDVIKRVCPSINIVNEVPLSKNNTVWGDIQTMYSSFSTNSEIRRIGSSGGTISAIAIDLLESGIVGGVLQVGGDVEDYTRNTLKISKNREDVLSCASSRYAPALVFDRVIQILESSDLSFCFIGKPCDISGLKNLLLEYPKYEGRIKLTVAILCAGMPSINATNELVSSFSPNYPIDNLVYRGNGWPGFFSFNDKNNQNHKKSYNDSWGQVLGKQIHLRCKICPDGIGLQADIAVGDAWETKDGYPDFTEKEGNSLLIVRTVKGSKYIDKFVKNGALSIAPLGLEKLKLMQPYQYNRRKKSGIRVVAIWAIKRINLNFKNLGLIRNTLSESPYAILREFIGSLKRSTS